MFNFLKSLLGNFSALVPLAMLFGVKASPELAAAQAAAPVAIAMMEAAETAMGDGTGEAKKEAVTTGLKAFASKMAELSTGGQKETWTAVNTIDIGAVINALADAANAVKKQG